jgi:preprotein translocase subunit SecE
MTKSRTKNEAFYFPSVANSIKYGTIVLVTAISASTIIIGINYGMSTLLSIC